jgi:hypothetical protein
MDLATQKVILADAMGGTFTVSVCRYCLSEHAPDLLAELESA